MAISTISNAGIASNAAISTSKLGAGAVLQVVQATNSTQTTNSSATWATTGLAATITPTSSTSKILARFSPNIYFGSANSIGCGLRIDRAGTTVYTTGLANNVSAITVLGGNYCIEYLDSPATISSTTYTLQFNCPFANSPTTYPTINYTGYNANGLTLYSAVILMEIAG